MCVVSVLPAERQAICFFADVPECADAGGTKFLPGTETRKRALHHDDLQRLAGNRAERVKSGHSHPARGAPEKLAAGAQEENGSKQLNSLKMYDMYHTK